MKVDGNITIFAGAGPANATEGSAANGAAKEQEKRETLFAGNLNQDKTLQDRIAEKKAQAQKKAMKLVGDVFAGDNAIDEDLESRREHVKELSEERLVLLDEREGIAAQQEDVEKALEAGDITQEEYTQMQAELKDAEKACDLRLDENESEAMQENATIRGTRLERLKKSPMVEAQKDAEEIMKAAGEEIIGMVREEGMDRIEEEAEEREEKAAERKEEREEQEARIEKQKEKREEEESWLEELQPDQFSSLVNREADVQQEVRDMLDKMKLLAEDIKGAAVDEML